MDYADKHLRGCVGGAVITPIWHEVEAAWREISPLGDEVLKVING